MFEPMREFGQEVTVTLKKQKSELERAKYGTR